jgi:hypothetical protein
MRHLFKLITISRKYLGLGNKSDIPPVLLDDRQIPCLGLLELLHHAVHLLIYIDISRSRLHVIIYMLRLIKVLLEHIATNILKRDKALKMVPRIQYREYIALRPRDNLDKLAFLAYEDQCSPANPRVPLVEDMKQILKEAYYTKEFLAE